jgi:hypothetical protein
MIDADTQNLWEVREERKALRTFRERALKALAWSFVASFAILVIIGIFIAFEPVPLSDWWDAALELAADVKAGKLSAWFALYSEHRPVLPNVVYWLDVSVFGGRQLFALSAGLVFAAFAWLLLFCIALPERTKPGDHRFYIGATLALLAFSWMQLPNFISGINAPAWFMAMFFPLATFFAIAKSKESSLYLMVAILSGIASVGTVANGLLALPIATALALALKIDRWRVFLLAMISVAVWAIYFTDITGLDYQKFTSFPSQSSMLTAFATPITFLQFFFAYVGSVAFYSVFIVIAGMDVLLHGWSATHQMGKQLNDYPHAVAWSLAIAEACGALFIAMVLWEIVHWYRSDRSPLGGALIALILFALGTGFLATIGRLDNYAGVMMAIGARYTTAMLFGLAAYVLLRARYLSYYQAAVLFFCVAIALLPRQLTALRSRASEYGEAQRAYQALKLGKATEADFRVLGDPDIVRRVYNRLKEMGIELPR